MKLYGVSIWNENSTFVLYVNGFGDLVTDFSTMDQHELDDWLCYNVYKVTAVDTRLGYIVLNSKEDIMVAAVCELN